MGKKIKTPNREYHIIDLNFEIKTYIKKIKKLIRLADKNGSATDLLEPGYHISIVAVDKLYKIKDEAMVQRVLDEVTSFDPNKEGWSNLTFPFSNYDTFYSSIHEGIKNFTPYSVLPLSAKNCVRLMMGQLFIRVSFDLESLKKKFEGCGWTVKMADLKSINRKNKDIIKKIQAGEGFMFEYVVDEIIFTLSKTDEEGTFVYEFPLTLIIIMISAFYRVDFLIDTVESSYKLAKAEKRPGQYTAFNYTGEQKILR